VICFRNSGQ